MQAYNVYCDESCHLEHDHQPVMVIGSIYCPVEKVREISARIREIKIQNGLQAGVEIKWSKVAKGKLGLFINLVDYFFDDDDLHFRAIIIPDKSTLNHTRFKQSHDEWYFKMYFEMLKTIFEPTSQYYIYIDIKDTRESSKVEKLHGFLCDTMVDYNRQVIKRVQIVRSHEIEIMQLVDVLVGAVCSVNKGALQSESKLALINRIKLRSRYSLVDTTLYRENKVNLLSWQAQG